MKDKKLLKPWDYPTPAEVELGRQLTPDTLPLTAPVAAVAVMLKERDIKAREAAQHPKFVAWACAHQEVLDV